MQYRLNYRMQFILKFKQKEKSLEKSRLFMCTKIYTKNKNEKRPLFLFKSVKEHGQKRLRIVAERVVAVAKAPIIEKRSFKKGISLQNFIC